MPRCFRGCVLLRMSGLLGDLMNYLLRPIAVVRLSCCATPCCVCCRRLCWLVWLCPDVLCCYSQLCVLCTHVLLSCRLTVPCPTVLHDTAFFRAFSLMSSCVGIRSLLAYWRFALRSMEELERRCWGGVVCFAARGELTCVVSSSRGGAWLWLFAILGFPN